MHINIKDMTEGMNVTGFYVLRDFATQKSKGGKDYIKASISDSSDTVVAMCWDTKGNYNVTHEDIGKVVKVAGIMNSFNGAPQFVIEQLRNVTEGDADKYDASDLAKVAPIDIDATKQDIETLIESIQDDGYKKFAQALFSSRLDDFLYYPAGKSVHHGFKSGLLMHTRNMMVLADFIAQMYPDIINRDLLICGTLGHDIAKIEEFDVNELMMVKDYSRPGQLLGHLYMGAKYACSIADEVGLEPEKSELIQHLILSHHGSEEMGSPVTPKCSEAEALHLIDMMDSRMEIYAEEYEDLQNGQFSQKSNWALSHKIFKP